jgi:homogentisate 1,2-dioxygenase
MSNALRYMSGFGGYFESEAVDGALPRGRNSPQRPAFGLYAEQLSGSSFTSARHENRRSWLYRMRPTADHRPFVRYERAPLFAAGTSSEPLAPNRLRWDAPADLPAGADFVDGMVTMLANRDPSDLEGVAVHLYRASKSMTNRVFVDADGELLIIPQQGAGPDGRAAGHHRTGAARREVPCRGRWRSARLCGREPRPAAAAA